MTEPAIAVPFGDGALRFPMPRGVSPRAVLDAIRALPGVDDVVLTEEYGCVYFDPGGPRPDPMSALAGLLVGESMAKPTTHVVRARYDGPDLDHVVRLTGLTRDEIAAVHSATEYEVRVVGFMPGFAYLATLDPRIVLPRRASPRTRVPAGSIAIAGARTGIYPFASPGGWHLIATAVDFVAFSATDGAALQLGDRVRFERDAT